MALFFYRPWAGTDKAIEYLTPNQSLYYTRWGYSALLGLTLAAGLAANITYLMGYITCPRAMLQVPHIAIVGLCIRDILVCLLVFPAALGWLAEGLVEFSGGPAWCGIAVFFDFFLNAVYPLLLITLALILYTRKVPPPKAPSREPSLRIASSRMSARSGYTHRTHQSQAQSQQMQRMPGRAPSVASQRPGQNVNPTGDFRRGFSKSLNGSVAGSDYGGSQVGRQKPQQFLNPMRGIEEEYNQGRGQRSVSPVGSDLWESASLDYPGREDGIPGEFDPIDEYDDEPRLREWLRLFVPLSFLLAMGFGFPAALNIETDARPNCFVKVNPFENTQSFIINDPGYNLVMCSVILTYLAPAGILLMLSLLLCTTRWTKDGKLNRFYKMCIALCLFFVAVKSPIDIIQFQNLIEAGRGNRLANALSSEIEYEILLVWSSLLPVIANPIIYLTCVSDYRVNIAEAWRSLRNGKEKSIEEEYFPETKETQESDVL